MNKLLTVVALVVVATSAFAQKTPAQKLEEAKDLILDSRADFYSIEVGDAYLSNEIYNSEVEVTEGEPVKCKLQDLERTVILKSDWDFTYTLSTFRTVSLSSHPKCLELESDGGVTVNQELTTSFLGIQDVVIVSDFGGDFSDLVKLVDFNYSLNEDKILTTEIKFEILNDDLDIQYAAVSVFDLKKPTYLNPVSTIGSEDGSKGSITHEKKYTKEELEALDLTDVEYCSVSIENNTISENCEANKDVSGIIFAETSKDDQELN